MIDVDNVRKKWYADDFHVILCRKTLTLLNNVYIESILFHLIFLWKISLDDTAIKFNVNIIKKTSGSPFYKDYVKNTNTIITY